ncbi:hypothetical protein FUT69_08940 [Xylella taiwanensis]|uniref:Uncharacterized protein n=1 Tax=Xylella taiwanensis TaxID=1444770 RepID=Z9JHW5_9GAMM|nr:hypothetical protein [Xylella taiwanensis]AXI82850.1 hypothetical protein AB672_02185 [Xylella taiwanensis]EWS77568.1 hypothetical protein AF72_10165 [Xylella taiwanensis]MCD8455860.1 hypothetical protein [Xylella taiwanensis]MCD8458264.1 hypothetical protein [Xylella taiwanensis]MCD8460401.1 hypothetical protein [Xylella taiwanensis]
MDAGLHMENSRCLVADDGFKMGYQWMQQERCPQCREKERFANQVRSCLSCGGRSNTCNPEGYDKDLYLVLLEHWSGCCQVTVQAALHVTVEAYLQYDGGFDFKCLRRVFGQNYYRDVQNKIGIAAMRCPMAYGNWSERVFDRPERFGKMKPRFPPGKSQVADWNQWPDSSADTGWLWLTEGIFDSIPPELHRLGLPTLLSSNNALLVDVCHKTKRDRMAFVWMLDGDVSSCKYTCTWVVCVRSDGWEYFAAQGRGKISRKAMRHDPLDQADRAEYLYQGMLLIAEFISAKMPLMYKKRKRREVHCGFDKRAFWCHWNETRVYPVRPRGTKDSGHESCDLLCCVTIVIGQNTPISASDAILQRIVHLHFDRSGHTVVTKALAEQIEWMLIEQMFDFILATTKRDAQVLDTQANKHSQYENQLLVFPELERVRLAERLGQVMVSVDALQPLLNLGDAQSQIVHEVVIEWAKQRQQSINADDLHIQLFWQQCRFLDGKCLVTAS